MSSIFKKLVRVRMGNTGETWRTAAQHVSTEDAPELESCGKGENEESRRLGLTSFRAQGLGGLDATEFNGTQLLDALRGRFNSRKQRLLVALGLFEFLLQHETNYGPPLGGFMIAVPISPDEVNAEGRRPMVIDAEVVPVPEDFAEVGQKPVVLQLDRLRVTLELDWHRPEAYYSITRFETGNGRDFATGERNFSEVRDLALATVLCGRAVQTLLAFARYSPATSNVSVRPEDPQLDEREREILDVVSDFQLAHGECAPATEVRLSFPPEDAAVTEAAVEALVKKGYLDRAADTLSLTPAGLLTCAQAEEAADLATRLVDYLRYQAGEQRARFTDFTWDGLQAANVAGDDEYGLVRSIIDVLRVEGSRSVMWGGPGGPVWRCPDDIAALRAISDIDGLRGRAERFRKEEAAAADAARQEVVLNQQAVKRARWDETWHRLREWTNGPALSERLAAQILLNEGYRDLDPTHPLGGPDGGKDAVCTKDGETWIMAVYFPRGQQKFASIKDKFLHDLRGVARNSAIGLSLVTNQELSNAERSLLRQAAVPVQVDLYHLERITTILDMPNMMPVRKQFLLIE